MSVRKLTATLIMTLAMVGVVNSTANAQEHFPVADPFAFDPDFRWFEPVYDNDLADMKPKKRANTGWFASYDRLNLWASRPELNDPNASEKMLDSGWGHRYELGYMLDNDHGWLFSSTSLNGPNAYFTIRQERLNRFNEQNLGEDGDGLTDPRFPGAPQLTIPPEDRNTPGEFRRIYNISDSENVLDFNSYELNKTWRMEPYHYGGILEPMVGFRWMRLTDTNQRQTYSSSADVNGNLLLDYGVAEQMVTDLNQTYNDALLGQVGFRYTKFRDRFTFTGDFRLFTGGSLQRAETRQTTEITIYDFDGGGIVDPELPGEADPSEFIINRAIAPQYTHNEEFVIGFDVRGEVNYQLTKMIAIRGGFQLIDVATGVWRGGPDPGVGGSRLLGGDRDQDVVMVGGTFGITLNR